MRRELHVNVMAARCRRRRQLVVEGSSCCSASHAETSPRRAPRQRGRANKNGGRRLMLLACMSLLGFAFGLQQTHNLLQRSSPPAPASLQSLFMESRPRARIRESAARSSRLWASPHPSHASAKVNVGAAEIREPPIFASINEHTERLVQCLHDEKDCTFSPQPVEILRSLMCNYTSWISAGNPPSQQKYKASAAIDKAFRLVTNEAFSAPYQLDWVNLGVEVLQLQLHSGELQQSTLAAAGGDSTSVNGETTAKLIPLEQPYNTIPKGTWLKALRAMTSKDISSSRPSTRSVKALSPKDGSQWMPPANAAFRILQRLVKGRGVRTFNNKRKSSQPKQMDERDFNMVLHAFARTLNPSSTVRSPYNTQMHKMHSVMALQERTPHAPPLSPVAYSILLKAYGQYRDIKNVEMSIRHAQRNGVVPDIVMANTVLDAFVNCGQLQRARDVMHTMTGGSEDPFWPLLKPNSRTYNTLLKGMAEEGDLRSAMKLSKEVRSKGLWDDVTTNTLVKAAVTAHEFDMAETILKNHTTTKHSRRRMNHPNVEAYTELIDGYAKDGQLENALMAMQLMQQRAVEPNEYTYTSIVGALARNSKVRQARKMMTYAAGLPIYKGRERVLTPIFNAFISGLLSSDGSGQSHAANIVEVLAVLEEMQEMGIHPNAVTVALVVDGLGQCNPPRCKEARELVQHLEFTSRVKRRNSGYWDQGERGASTEISLSNNKIASALIRCYGQAEDVKSATELYSNLPSPDVVAFNALLDACCRSDQLKLALEMFRKVATSSAKQSGRAVDDKKRAPIKPDVVTYTTLISALLQLKSRAATTRASALYKEMKEKRWISPDTILVDTILTGMISGGPIGFQDDDVKFTLEVLRDGARLEWEPGQYEKRKRAVRGILVGCSSEIWKQDAFAFGLVSEQPEDPLFTKKGWNTIDSGFRLWGGGGDDLQETEGDGASVDSFLASKGWNDIDSGFRLL